jgi:hypothetical protein
MLSAPMQQGTVNLDARQIASRDAMLDYGLIICLQQGAESDSLMALCKCDLENFRDDRLLDVNSCRIQILRIKVLHYSMTHRCSSFVRSWLLLQDISIATRRDEGHADERAGS